MPWLCGATSLLFYACASYTPSSLSRFFIWDGETEWTSNFDRFAACLLHSGRECKQVMSVGGSTGCIFLVAGIYWRVPFSTPAPTAAPKAPTPTWAAVGGGKTGVAMLGTKVAGWARARQTFPHDHPSTHGNPPALVSLPCRRRHAPHNVFPKRVLTTTDVGNVTQGS